MTAEEYLKQMRELHASQLRLHAEYLLGKSGSELSHTPEGGGVVAVVEGD